MAIRKLGDLAKESFQYLKKLQDGKEQLVKTGYSCIDEHLGGLLKGSTVSLSALSGHGKSEMLFRLRENVLNTDINPNADNFVWLNYNLEVKIFNVLLRGLQRKLRKKKQRIMFDQFSEEEKVIVKKYYKGLEDNRQFVCQNAVTAEEFYEQTYAFLTEHRDKEGCFISFDHVALIGDKNTSEGIEKLIGYINKLKLEFESTYFFPISQLNRKILERVDEKSNRSSPNAGDIYQSSTIDFIADYNIIIFNAYKVGIEQFLKVNPDRYDYLSQHFGEEDSKGRVSFNTMGKLFYKVIKTRETDEPWKDLYIEDMDLSTEELSKMKSDIEIEKDVTPVFNAAMPIFGSKEFDNDESPF